MQDLMAICSNKGTQIENCEIVHTIREVHLATVKLAWHVIARTEVALKVIKKWKWRLYNLQEFLSERRSMMLLDNESIVQLLNVIDMKDFTIMVMEYMSGGDMQTYLDQQCHMTEKEAQCPFRQLLSALNHCHEWGIVHRNLKPSNLLLDVDQKVKIADFGLSNNYHPEEKLCTVHGAPAFTALEIFWGWMFLGPLVDVWSLGIVLYIMVSEFEPFEGQDYQEMKQSVLTGHYHVTDYL